MRIVEDEKPPLEFLAHFGVKGMRWGQRRQHRQEMRRLNKASKQRDQAARNAEIDAARGRFATGENARALKVAKAKFKRDKNVIGKREAKKKLLAVRDRVARDNDIASQTKHGAEAAGAVLAIVGTGVIAAGLSSARAARPR